MLTLGITNKFALLSLNRNVAQHLLRSKGAKKIHRYAIFRRNPTTPTTPKWFAPLFPPPLARVVLAVFATLIILIAHRIFPALK